MKVSVPKGSTNETIIGVLLIAILVSMGCRVAQAGTGETSFPRPPKIKAAIDFWTRVYSEIDSNSGFVHDSKELNVVYEVFPLPTYASPKRQHRIIQKRIRHYQQLLRKIAVTPDTELSTEERRVRHLWGINVSPAKLRLATKRIRFQRGQSDRMREGLKRAAKYEKEIRRILHDKGVPEQLAALPHVESSYNPRVKSKAGAVGLWQIMPATGRRYLRVNNIVDERLDPYKATNAAAQLLKHNHSVLKSWPLAITAYNHGLSGIRRAVRKTGSKDIDMIIQKYNGRSFKFASRNFYAAFLAAYDVSSSQRAWAEENEMDKVPVVALNAYMPAAVIIKGLGVSEKKLKEHNPDLGASVWRGEKYIPKSYRLHIPVKRDRALLQTQVVTLEERSGHEKQVSDLFYQVQRGDSLSKVAQSYDTSIMTLMTMNDLRSRHRINEGQVLRIPQAHGAHADPSVLTKGLIAGAQSSTSVADTEQAEPEPVPMLSQAPESDSNIADKRDEPGRNLIVDVLPENDESSAGENETVLIVQSDLAADPADYLVAEDNTIEVQVGETLGHYANWLQMPTQYLRALNGMRFGEHVIMGKRLRLEFQADNVKTFEQKRKDFHSEIQNRFFRNHHIVDVKEHVLAYGDNLWELSTQTYKVPLWLLRQYNPDLAFDTVLPLSSSLRVPVVQLNDDNAMSAPAPATASARLRVGSNL